MATLAASMLLPSKLKPAEIEDVPFLSFSKSTRIRPPPKFNNYQSSTPVMRLFGPAIFEASKLKVLFLGEDKEKQPQLPRTYTLTHSDVTSNLTLAISQTINNSQLQGWYNRLQRDEVVAEWKKVKGKMSLHVHCHISGGHFLLDLVARLRFYIFRKELPVVLKAFVHGDKSLFNSYPELEEALVYVYFHSSLPEFNKVECWGPLNDAVAPTTSSSMKLKKDLDFNLNGVYQENDNKEKISLGSNSISMEEIPKPCKELCTCCFPSTSVITWSNTHSLSQEELPSETSPNLTK